MSTAALPPAGGGWRQRLLARCETDRLGRALGRVAAYVALRLWIAIVLCFPIEMNLASARLIGRIWYYFPTGRLRDHRRRALGHLRESFPQQTSDAWFERVARLSFEHLAQLYLVELAMTPRLVTEWTWPRYVELGALGPALRELLSGPAILVTGHFGNYELLGHTICKLGLPLTALMRPLDNPLINDYLVRTREAGGLSLLFKRGAMEQAPRVLDRGGLVSFIGDQDAGGKSVFVDFFGRPAATYKSIGLLAMLKRVPVIVGSAVRIRRGFRYRIEVERIIRPEEWETQTDPLHWITQTFTHALEAAIRRHPEQYLWIHRRWKHTPAKTRRAG